MLDSVRTALKRYNMLNGADSVTVALSGGADSVALLYALYTLKAEYGYSLNAAHLNHCLRGEESDGDEEFCKKLCQKYGISFTSERADISKFAQESGQSIELAARQVRYAFLERVSEGVIATAHTASDNIETVLYNVSRGTGIKGLCGIPAKRDNIIRPLINVTRTEVEQYCIENCLDFRTDSTNNENIYARNRIRHSAVPVLESVNQGATKNVSRMCRLLENDADFLQNVADSVFARLSSKSGINIAELEKLHIAVSSRCVAKLFEQTTGRTLEAGHIEQIFQMLGSDSVRTSISGEYFAVKRKGFLKFEKNCVLSKKINKEIESLPFISGNIKIKEVDFEEFERISRINSLLLNNAVDCDKICGKITLRNRLPADKIELCGRGVTKTLKKLFNESDIPLSEREMVPLVADEKGVIWIKGFGISERVAVKGMAKKVVIFECL